MGDIVNTLSEIKRYLGNAASYTSPVIAVVWSAIMYLLFPEQAYIQAAVAVGVVMFLDVITKYYSLAKPYGSLIKAIKAGVITSSRAYQGVKKKLISFLVLMILCGLSVRVVPVDGVVVFLGTFVYAIMFLRESQSILENLIEAGHDDLCWLVPILKKKQKSMVKIMNEEERDDQGQ